MPPSAPPHANCARSTMAIRPLAYDHRGRALRRQSGANSTTNPVAFYDDSSAFPRIFYDPNSVAAYDGNSTANTVLRQHAVVEHPAGSRRLSRRRCFCLHGQRAARHPEGLYISGLHSHGLFARVPTHRRPSGARLAADLLARLWSDGNLTRWTMDRISGCSELLPSFLTSMAWSHRWTGTATVLLPSRPASRSASRRIIYFGAAFPRPIRSRAYASPTVRRKARCRPAG